jgi:hypothetical protein
MANLDFPSNPSNNDTYVINGTTYVYNSTKGYWRIQTATSLEDLTLTGDLTVAGTVDGRDVSVDGTKLDGIEAGADVTDTANVTAAGALMDSEVTNLAAVKAFDPTDYATAAQGTLADSSVQPGDSPSFVNITVSGTVDGRDVAIDGTKLDGIEAGAEVNVGTDLGNSASGTALTVTSSTGNNTNLPAATTSAWGVMTDEDKTKLDGIEASADVTDAGNVNPLVDAHLNTSTATTNQVLSWTGSDYDWVNGGTDPAGSNTQIQFNNSGAFGASANLTWNGTTLTANSASFTQESFFLDDVSFSGATTTRNVFNTVATTVNAFGAATTLNIGASTGTTTIGNDLSVTGDLSLSADPTTSLQAATKQYVDTVAAAGLHYHLPVRVERPSTDGNLNATYINGSSGVGATLTNAGTQEALVIDGITLNTNDRVLIYNQTNGYENGVYTVTNTGSGSTNWVLTRATDADSYSPSDPDSLGQGDAFFVREGNTGAGELYVMNTSGTITFGTTNITFTEVASTAVYQAGTGLTLNGVTFSTNQDISTTASPTFVNLTATGNITVTGTVDGRDVSADGTKLDGIEAGAEVNVGTDLGNSATGSSFTITSSTGNNTNLPAATTSAWGMMTDNDKTKLDGIEASADVTDAGNVNPLVDAHLNTSTATTNQVLSWTGSDYDWVDQSGGSVALNDLTDVTITSPATGQIIVYNGTNSQWENSGSVSFDNVGLNLNGVFNFVADDSSGVVQLKGPATVPDLLQVFKMPGDDGANGDVLTTDGNGNLSFTTPSGGGGGGITTGKAIAMAMVFG